MDIPFPPPWSIHELSWAYRVDDATGRVLTWHLFDDEKAKERWSEFISAREAHAMARWVASLPYRLSPDWVKPKSVAPGRVILPLPWSNAQGARSHMVKDIRGRVISRCPFREPPMRGHLTAYQAERLAYWIRYSPVAYQDMHGWFVGA